MPTTKTSFRNTTTYGRTSSPTSRTNSNTGWNCNSPKFNTVRNECYKQIGSFRTICSQISGGATTGFSPILANKFVRMVNDGAYVYKFNNEDCTRFFGTHWNTTSNTNTTTFRCFRQKFGAGIKAVCRGKGNTWIVAASPTVNARPFNNYNWK